MYDSNHVLYVAGQAHFLCHCSNKETVKRYQKEYPAAQILPWSEAEKAMIEAGEKQYSEEPSKLVNQERWDEMLGILPPARYGSYEGVKAFHLSERLTADVVMWLCHAVENGLDKYVEFNASEFLTASEIRKKFEEA